MEFDTILVKRILALIDEKNLTVNRLATLSELNGSALDKIIKGKTTNPTLSTLTSIALGLGISVSELLDFEEINNISFVDIRKYKNKKYAIKRPTDG